MCVLHVTSESSSFEGFLNTSSLPVYRSHEKGDISIHGKRQPASDFGFSCTISEKPWTDLAGQIEYAHEFVTRYSTELKTLSLNCVISDIRLDFPYSCRLDNQFFTQCDYLPAGFLRIVGELGIGIELSHYPPHDQGS